MTALEERQQKEIDSLREENRLLREKVDLLVRRIYGAKSEHFDAAQLRLLFGELSDGQSEAGTGAKRR